MKQSGHFYRTSARAAKTRHGPHGRFEANQRQYETAGPADFSGRLPVDGLLVWKAIHGQKAKQPYAIAMKDGAPFGTDGVWENWKEPISGDWIRTFAIITTNCNELVADSMTVCQSSGHLDARPLRRPAWRRARPAAT